MKTAIVAAAVLLLAVAGLSTYTLIVPGLVGTSPMGNGSAGSSTSALASPGTGSVSFYLTDAPPAHLNLSYLLVNVTSVTLRYAQSNVTTTASQSSTNSSRTTSSTTTVSTTGANTSAGKQASAVNQFVFQVPSSVGTNVNLTKLQGTQLLLGTANAPAGSVTEIVLNITGAQAFFTNGTSSRLKVVADGKLMVPIHFEIQSGGTSNLTADIQPSSIHISQGNAKVLSPVIHVTVVSTGSRGTTTVTISTSVTETSSATT